MMRLLGRSSWAALCVFLVLGVGVPPGAQGGQSQEPSGEKEQTLSERVQEEVDSRVRLGLRHDDRGFIRELLRNPDLVSNSSQDKYGLLLTPEEEDAIEQWNALSNSLDFVRTYVKQHDLVDRYAGVFITDQQDGGQAWIGFVGELPEHETRIRNNYKYPERLSFFRASYSEVELDRLVDAISADIRELEEMDINVQSVGTSTTGNAVDIYVDHTSPTTVATLEQRYGRDRIRVLESEQPVLDSRSYHYPPIVAGTYISGAQAACTSLHGQRVIPTTTIGFSSRLAIALTIPTTRVVGGTAPARFSW